MIDMSLSLVVPAFLLFVSERVLGLPDDLSQVSFAVVLSLVILKYLKPEIISFVHSFWLN